MNTGCYTVTSVATASKVRVRTIACTDSMATLPVSERWIWENREAMQMFIRGKEDVRAGRVLDLGSFAQYADLDVDD